MAEIDELREIISALEGGAFYPPVAITDKYGPPMVVCANGHAWGSIDYTKGCPRCLEAHAFRLKGRTECIVEGCDELVTCSDTLWERGNRMCRHHWTEDAGFTVGPVSVDESMAALAQYNPRNRWNGWLADPRFDTYSVEAILKNINEAYGDTPYYRWDWEERDGEMVLVMVTFDYDVDGSIAEEYTEEYHPDEDGLYTFGNGWVWYEDDELYGTTEEWREWERAMRTVSIEANNAHNQMLHATGRYANQADWSANAKENEEAARKAVTEWLKDNPEPPKYPDGKASWVDLTGRETT